MLSRALLLLGVARVCGFASIRKIGGERVGVGAESIGVGGAEVNYDPLFCTNVLAGEVTQVDACGSLTSQDVCGESYTKVISYKIATNGMFYGCIWDADNGLCVDSQVFYRCHPSCQGGPANNTMTWPSPPPPPSPSPPGRRELDAITAGRSLESGTCTGGPTGFSCPGDFTGEGTCTNGWSQQIDAQPKCNGNQKITSIVCTKVSGNACTCTTVKSQPINNECIDVIGNYDYGNGDDCCLNNLDRCPD